MITTERRGSEEEELRAGWTEQDRTLTWLYVELALCAASVVVAYLRRRH